MSVGIVIIMNKSPYHTPYVLFAQSAGAVEYTDCASAEG